MKTFFCLKGIRVIVMLVFLSFAGSVPVGASDKNNKVSPTIVKKITQTMLRNGILTQSCIDEAGNEAIITVTAINLRNKNSKPQFEVSAGSVPTSCTMGARSSFFWLFDNEDTGYKLLLDAGLCDQLKKTKDVTNGYFDIETGSYLKAGEVIYVIHYKFNGNVYEKQFSKEIKNK